MPIKGPVHKAIGEVIRETRNDLELKQEPVATKLGWPQGRLSQVEKGNRILSVAELVELGWAMNVDSLELLRKAIQRAGPAISTQRHRVRARLRKPKQPQ